MSEKLKRYEPVILADLNRFDEHVDVAEMEEDPGGEYVKADEAEARIEVLERALGLACQEYGRQLERSSIVHGRVITLCPADCEEDWAGCEGECQRSDEEATACWQKYFLEQARKEIANEN